MPDVLRCENFDARYADPAAVKNVSLTVRENEVISLISPDAVNAVRGRREAWIASLPAGLSAGSVPNTAPWSER